MPETKQIKVAIITHAYGQNIYASTTPEGITKQVYQYVKENWKAEVPDLPMPKNKIHAISLYFDQLQEKEWLDENIVDLVD